jgi:hypothetical protein
VRILLVHGLWRTPLSFARLARRLRRQGHATEQFGYAAVAETYPRIVARLARRLALLAQAEAEGAPGAADGAADGYVVIGHSLGGVLLRAALPRVAGPPPRRLIMLGTPNRPPRLARTFSVLRPYRWLLGQCGAHLADPAFYATLPLPTVPYTIVAGTAGPRGRLSPFGDDANDGTVAVRETLVRDDDPVITLPVFHAFMMNHPAVQAEIAHALHASREPAGAGR